MISQPQPKLATSVTRWVSIFLIIFLCQGQSPADNFVAYTQPLAQGLTLAMVPVAGGTFRLGSLPTEAHHQADEGPVHVVTVEPFWMASHEISWDLYEPFINLRGEKTAPNVEWADALSRPTPPYVDMSFGMGKAGFPAVGMTHYAAAQFCGWLTRQTGHFYRLPTEAEWEYACRAGTQTAYYFGDDPAQLDAYAWHYGNSDGKYQPVGSRKPNAWGLYDMHGNATEWTLNSYHADGYQTHPGSAPWTPPTELYGRVVRGGSWDDDPEQLRSAARRPSVPRWKQRDPQLPKSRWWLTDAPFVGFRVIRPVNPPPRAEWARYWLEPIEDL